MTDLAMRWREPPGDAAAIVRPMLCCEGARRVGPRRAAATITAWLGVMVPLGVQSSSRPYDAPKQVTAPASDDTAEVVVVRAPADVDEAEARASEPESADGEGGEDREWDRVMSVPSDAAARDPDWAPSPAAATPAARWAAENRAAQRRARRLLVAGGVFGAVGLASAAMWTAWYHGVAGDGVLVGSVWGFVGAPTIAIPLLAVGSRDLRVARAPRGWVRRPHRGTVAAGIVTVIAGAAIIPLMYAGLRLDAAVWLGVPTALGGSILSGWAAGRMRPPRPP
jgi:hypothetical protein